MIETIRVGEITALRAGPSNASRRPVLFVHGYFVDGSIWTHWLGFFAARGVPAVAVHLRGRAGSRPGTNLGRVSMNDFADDAAEVARHVGADVVVGHSMGGLVAQKLAERGNVAACVLVAPAPPRGISVLSPRVARRQVKYLPAILRSRPVVPSPKDLHVIVMNRVPPDEERQLLANMLPDSGRAGREMSITGVPVDASRVRCPMLVIAADDDRFIPRRIVERIARRYSAPLEVVPAHGHMVIVEPDWQRLAARIEAWIRERA
jgi:pimeloyl-ACP methyl ester carboxylesterase